MKLYVPLVAAALILSGCSSVSQPPPSEKSSSVRASTSETAPPPGGMSVEQDNAFLTRLETHGITTSNPDAVISAAHAICAMFEQGKSENEVGNTLTNADHNMTQRRTTAMIDASTYAYCPDYAPKAPA